MNTLLYPMEKIPYIIFFRNIVLFDEYFIITLSADRSVDEISVTMIENILRVSPSFIFSSVITN